VSRGADDEAAVGLGAVVGCAVRRVLAASEGLAPVHEYATRKSANSVTPSTTARRRQ
jgi:hypothetical protein